LKDYVIRFFTGKSRTLFGEFHAYNLRSIGGSGDSLSLNEIFQQQPLWKDYFSLCNLWNISICNSGAMESGPWYDIASAVRRAALPILELLDHMHLKKITLRELQKILPQ
jgi:hypothetical protein